MASRFRDEAINLPDNDPRMTKERFNLLRALGKDFLLWLSLEPEHFCDG